MTYGVCGCTIKLAPGQFCRSCGAVGTSMYATPPWMTQIVYVRDGQNTEERRLEDTIRRILREELQKMKEESK